MMAESYTSVLDENRCTLVSKVDPEPFLDFLRQLHILSEEDCQIIQNYYHNKTRRERMRCFLDILSTKGPEGVSSFCRQLGWELPHVYLEIFNKEPEPPPESYCQDVRSRLSCNLEEILRMGRKIHRVQAEHQDLSEKITEMEAMLKHQRNEMDDLERENSRLRRFELDNQKLQKKLHILTENNDKIKEENRQFLYEIRTLNLEMHKWREQEVKLQGQLDEMAQQIQDKSLELNKKSKEESDLRAKFERERTMSQRLQQTITARRPPRQLATLPTNLRECDLQVRLDMVVEDLKNLEDTNKGLCEQIADLQNLVDEEREERDQMHRRVCMLERDKGMLENRLSMATEKTERYFSKIKELEAEKMKLEEERIQMQQKCWETSKDNEKQFEKLHTLEMRYDCLLQEFEQFRQNHRYCPPPRTIAASQSAWPMHKYIDVGEPGLVPSEPACGAGIERSESLKVNTSSSMRRPRRNKQEDPQEEEDGGEGAEDTAADSDACSTISEESSLGSVFEEIQDVAEVVYEAHQQQSLQPSSASGFFVRANVTEKADAGSGGLTVDEGDILLLQEMSKEQLMAVKVDRATGKLLPDQHGTIPSYEKGRLDGNGGKYMRILERDQEKSGSLSRQGAIRRVLRHQDSAISAYTPVAPMKATRALPVLVLGPPSAVDMILKCMAEVATDWACVLADTQSLSSSQLFAPNGNKHNVLQWQGRPKGQNINPYKSIIITVNLSSEEAVKMLGEILGQENLQLDVKQESEKLKELLDFVKKAGFHWESLDITEGVYTKTSFLEEMRQKVQKVQHQIFWL